MNHIYHIYIYLFIIYIYIYNVCVNIMKSMGFPTEHPSRFRRDLQAGADGSMAGVEEVAGVAVQNLDHHRVGHWAVAWPLRGRCEAGRFPTLPNQGGELGNPWKSPLPSAYD